MFRLVVLFACAALAHSHAVVPYVSAVHTAPLVVPYPVHHGYFAPGLLGHGFLAKPIGHHILKRSPHYVAPFVAPVAVSHQSRVDLHAPLVAPILPVVKPLVTPYAAPLYHKPLLAPLYGAGHYGSLYPHLSHGLY